MKESILATKSLDFAVRIVKFYKFLYDEKKTVTAKSIKELKNTLEEIISMLVASIKTKKGISK